MNDVRINRAHNDMSSSAHNHMALNGINARQSFDMKVENVRATFALIKIKCWFSWNTEILFLTISLFSSQVSHYSLYFCVLFSLSLALSLHFQFTWFFVQKIERSFNHHKKNHHRTQPNEWNVHFKHEELNT